MTTKKFKTPSNRSIRSAITTLDRADLIFAKVHEEKTGVYIIQCNIPQVLMAPKQTIKKLKK